MAHRFYVYSKNTFAKHYLDMDRAFGFIEHQICFAGKVELVTLQYRTYWPSWAQALVL